MRCLRRTSLGIGVVALLLNSQALANPTGGAVTQGSASFSSSGSQFTINQTSANTFINWQSFNIAPGETTTFNQPSANSVAWNQIGGANPSQILGNLNANGYIVLENPDGFYIGGQAVLNVHGLLMTTASTPAMNLSDGGAWTFDAPPPMAKIQNYGQINISGGGTAYLIAGDIINNGTISAPNGRIGLYDGETVLVSTSPNGEGLSAEVTLPQGSVDNEGKLTADGGSIVAQAQFVNQNGVIQADTVQNVNGTIELLGGSSVMLGANSVISATGDSTAATPSAGGAVTVKSGGIYSDQVGSMIDVSGGTQGGNGGQVEISAPEMGVIATSINGTAANGYSGGILTIDPDDIWLASANTDPAAPANFSVINVNSFSGLLEINLLASDDIILNTIWTVSPVNGVGSSVLLQAGNEIELNSSSEIEADGGNITLKAPMVDIAGTLQSDSIGNASGVIEIDASQSLTLEASSTIIANGDPNAITTPGPGGFVVLNAENTFSDNAGSTISVTGTAGGQGGIVEIFDPQAGTTPIQTAVSGAFVYVVNPYDLTLSGDPTGTSFDNNNNLDANFNVSDLAAYSQIDLQALDDVTLNTGWTLNDPGVPAALSLTAGNNITLTLGSDIFAGQDWTVNLTAGTGFVPTVGQPAPVSGSDGIYMNGNADATSSAYIKAQNGNINLWAANEIQVGWSGSSAGAGDINSGVSSITTIGGGGINAVTEYGDVNTGSDPNGFKYSGGLYTIDPNLGGISTADGGNVTIAAGGNVISYFSTDQNDAGTGAFGAYGSTQPGNVSITAGGSVYGHYVVTDGMGTITAGQDAGSSLENQIALSLTSGGWTVNAPNGNIYLQEVRNPNGVFDNTSPGKRSKGLLPNTFTYDSQAYVDLTANAVYLTGFNIPRPSGDVPILYPSILDITAGSGGVTLENNLTLYPSPYQNLDITTTGGGDLTGTAGFENPFQLYMSDSAQDQWTGSSGAQGTFSVYDHGSLANEPNDSTPVLINISGNIEDLYLLTDKATEITVGGDLINCSFSGQNLQASDITSINVAGQIYSTSPYSFTILSQAIPAIPAEDLLPGEGNSWDDIFTLAVNPSLLAGELTTLQNQGTPISQWAIDFLQNAGYFEEEKINGQLIGVNPGFVYNATTGRLGFTGPMSSSLLTELTQSITILHLVNGQPVIDNNPSDNSPGRMYGQIETDTISWVGSSALNTLSQESQGTPTLSADQPGYRIGGPGQFDITANSISLGNSDGILSLGIYDPNFDRFGNLASITPAGATINVTVTGPDYPTDSSLPVGPSNPLVASLDMLTSTIASLDGGSVNVVDTAGSMDLGSSELLSSSGTLGSTSVVGSHFTFGIFTSGGGGANVIAEDDVDINGSRIATYDGGDIFVESLTGDVDVGDGTADLNTVDSLYSSESTPYSEDIYGSGIIANTLEPSQQTGEPFPPGAARVPGNITVETPQGDITADSAGIVQEALDGSVTPGPVVTLTAGTPASSGSPGYVGNIDLGNSGVIGGEVNLTANGNINGQIVSRQNSDVNAAQSFSGTLLAGGSANVSGGGTVSGTIIGVGGANVSGAGGVTASVLGQNVSVNGGSSQSTLGSSATATASTQSAAQQANSQSQQVVENQTGKTDDKKKKPQIRKVGRVTVILSAAVPQ
ncbi:MAG TPA: filamentous hemagglutinin N-terminal domain-containing protein [Verrucomicrobiae bacterium]